MSDMLNGQRHDRSALILYGTETGNSQDVAEELGRITERLHFLTRVCEMDEVDIQGLSKYTFVIFALSTTGQGEFPKNARRFWNSLLRKRLPPNCLSHVNFTTFGLGDSSYAKFNFASRKLHKRLEQLGGNEIYPRGEADEQHDEGIDGTFLSWYIDLRKKLLEAYPLPDGLDPIPDDVLLPPKYWLELADESSTDVGKSNSLLDNTDDDGQTESDLLNGNLAPTKDWGASNLPKNSTDPDTLGEAHIQAHQSSVPNTATMRDRFGLDSGIRYDHGFDAPGPPSNRLTDYHTEQPEDDNVLPPPALIKGMKKNRSPLIVTMEDNKRVTPPDHWQDVREITFKLRGRDFMSNPGDTISIYPKNFPEDVQALIDLMGWNDVADLKLHFKPKSPDWFGAQNLIMPPDGLNQIRDEQTLRELLIHNLDFQAIPKRRFFELIASYTDDPTHKARLLEFRNPLYTDELYDYTTRPRRSILECLQDFPSVKLPWKDAITIFPTIRGREFSICSGGNFHNPSVVSDKDSQKSKELNNYGAFRDPRPFRDYRFQILVAIVKYRTVLQKVRNGLCSRYLATLPKGTNLTVQYNANPSFYKAPPLLPDLPLILIGAGTGIAPLRSLILQRLKEIERRKGMVQFGKVHLIYGGRNRRADYFYADDWESAQAKDYLHASPVFSRDQKQKIYVQDEIGAQGKEIADLLVSQKVLIYVCGSSGGMPKAVRCAFLFALQMHAGMSMEVAEDLISNMERLKRYIQETW
ncbi:flavodoxin [Botrytis cinerea]